MFTSLKRKIDRWVITLAAKNLTPGRENAEQLEQVARVIADPDLFRLPEGIPDIRFGDGNDFTFTSSIQMGSEKVNLVQGRFFRAGESWREKPAVILVHGWNAELHYLHVLPLVARALNRRGMNAVLVELPYHLHRRPPRTERMHDFISDDLPGMLRAARQSLADFHSLAGWCRAQGCPGVGLWGFSLGGWLVGLYVCASPLAQAAVLTTPVSDLQRAIRELEFCHPVRSGLAGVIPQELIRLNLAEHRPLIPPEQILLMESAYDAFIPSDSYRNLATAWGIERWHTVPQSHVSVLVSPRAMREVMDWLEVRLAISPTAPV